MAVSGSISIEAYLFIEVKDKIFKYKFDQVVTSVGSAEDNVVRIKDPSITKHHVLFTYVEGKFFLRRVEDSPVRLNGEKVESYSEELRGGDVIQCGDVRLRLAEGGSSADTAVMLILAPHMPESIRPWYLFLSKKCEITVGENQADLFIFGSLPQENLVIENYGAGLQYLVPPQGAKVLLNEEIVQRRVRLHDRDVIKLRAHTMRVRILSKHVMDDPEALLWPEMMRKYEVPLEKWKM